MKNNIIISFIFLFFFNFIFTHKVNSEDLKINANEIQSLNKGDKLIAKNGVEIIDSKGIVIKADEAEYIKSKSKIKVKYNVDIKDVETQVNKKVEKYFDLLGNTISSPTKNGIYLILYDDGTVEKQIK